jgi:RNA polymerase primary sigma factor
MRSAGGGGDTRGPSEEVSDVDVEATAGVVELIAPSQARLAALQAVENIVYRSGAPVDTSRIARVIDRHKLGAEDSALLRVEARAQGLFVDEDAAGDDTDEPVAAVASVGTGALAAGYESLAPFWRTARRYPLLDARQERNLAMRIKQGLRAGALLAGGPETDAVTRRELDAQIEDGKRAKDAFICCNLRLVGAMVRPYRAWGLEMPDLLQEGVLGLIRAVEKFDHDLGYKFSTYATWWIRQAAQRAVADKGRTIRIPVHVHDLLRKIIKTERRLCWELEREPTIHDVADAIGVDPGHVAFVKEASAGVVSLDAAVRGNGDDDETPLIEFIAGIEPSVEQRVIERTRTEHLQAALGQLSQRDLDVLRKRHGLGDGRQWTLDEVGRDLGVTRERVRQLEGAAIKKLRPLLEQDTLIHEPQSTKPEVEDESDEDQGPEPPTSARPKDASPLVDGVTIDVVLRQMSCLTHDEKDVMVRRFGVGRPSMSEYQVATALDRSKTWVLAHQSSAVRRLRAQESR